MRYGCGAKRVAMAPIKRWLSKIDPMINRKRMCIIPASEDRKGNCLTNRGARAGFIIVVKRLFEGCFLMFGMELICLDGIKRGLPFARRSF